VNTMAEKSWSVLVVDDSPTIAALICGMLDREADFHVAGQAANGREAVAMAEQLQPDLITMDVQMPEMDGLEATRRIMESSPRRIIMVTAATRNTEMRVAFRAIEAGALAVVEKPRATTEAEFGAIRHQLLDTLRNMATVPVFRRSNRAGRISARTKLAPIEVVAVGVSTGGPQIVNQLLAALPAHFPCPIAITQHMSAGFIDGMARWLDDNSALTVKIARAGEVLYPGCAYLAPDNAHLTIKTHGADLRSHRSQRAPVNGFRPSATPLFESVAQACPGRALGIILSGMGEDGAVGLKAMHDAGCTTIAQSERGCLVYSMPKAAVELGAASHSMTPEEMVAFLQRYAGETP